MPDVLLSNDDITVLGPPAVVELLVDIGPTGTRGSQVFVGVGDPNSIEIGQTPLLNDLFINTSPGGELGYMYQYVSEPGGDTWIKVLDLNPAIYSINYEAIFSAGTTSITIPISDIVNVTGSPLTADNFNVQHSITHTNPIASSISVPALVGDGSNLVVDLTAVEYSSESGPAEWLELDGYLTVHLVVSIVPGLSS
jgi:hypothetical protein